MGFFGIFKTKPKEQRFRVKVEPVDENDKVKHTQEVSVKEKEQ